MPQVGAAALSPDGKQFALVRDGQIVLVAADGGWPNGVDDHGGAQNPDWRGHPTARRSPVSSARAASDGAVRRWHNRFETDREAAPDSGDPRNKPPIGSRSGHRDGTMDPVREQEHGGNNDLPRRLAARD